MSTTKNATLLSSLSPTVEKLTKEFDSISAERKGILQQLVQFVEKKVKANQPVYLKLHL
ncbi:MAG: hypothetical protein U5K54_29320 [Cytophagales bacterium]|nr:hypothetical protein [Cytophagales bacterium]